MSASQRPLRLLALFVASIAFASAQTIVLTPDTTLLSSAGGSLTFTASISYSPKPSTLALSLSIPTGWSYVSGTSIPGTGEPFIAPSAGRTSFLEWAIASPPASPATFTFTLAYSANPTGPIVLTPTLISRDGSGGPATTITGSPIALLASSNSVTWLGGTGNWSDPSQWSPGVVPNNTTGAGFTVAIAAGLVTLSSAISIDNLTFTGGRINGSNTLTMTGTASNWTAGIFSGAGEIVIASGAQMTASGAAAHVFTERTIRNQGTFLWSNNGALQSGSGGAFINSAGATFIDATSGPTDAFISGATGTFSFTNAGTFSKSGTGTTQVTIAYSNSGNIILTGGTLRFTDSFVQSAGLLLVRAGTTARFDQGLNFSSGTLQGAGTVVGNVTNGGTIAPGESVGTLKVQGNLTLLSSSRLVIEISGAAQGTGYDFLQVSGNVALGGSLSLSMLPGSQTGISATDTLTLLTASSLTGAFADLPNGSRFNASSGLGSFLINYTTTSVTLTGFLPVPEPSTWCLLGAGTAVLATTTLRRRRTG